MKPILSVTYQAKQWTARFIGAYEGENMPRFSGDEPREAIRKALRSTGYSADGLIIHVHQN